MTNKCRFRGIIKAIAIVAIISNISLFAVPIYAQDNPSRRLILFQGSILHAYFDNKYVEVKRLSPNGHFYGYGWLDDHTVFTAYQPEESAEAIANFEILDLRKGKTTKLDGIGGVGESNFDVNPTTGEIVFNDGDDLKLLKFNEKRNAYRIHEIKKKAACWAVFWIDSKTVGCKDTQKDILVKYSIPSK
jgi:hypothetical protein